MDFVFVVSIRRVDVASRKWRISRKLFFDFGGGFKKSKVIERVRKKMKRESEIEKREFLGKHFSSYDSLDVWLLS